MGCVTSQVSSLPHKKPAGEELCPPMPQLHNDILALRATEYSRLDKQKQIYLDFTGAGLYPESLIKWHMKLLLENTLGNPHSSNPTSSVSTHLVEGARNAVLKFFNADPAKYICIFTINASGALRIVGESYPFGPNAKYMMLMDNHNSVNGIREFAHHRGAKFTYVAVTPGLRIDEDFLEKHLNDGLSGPKLFAYPAQSNFSGVKHSLEWVKIAQKFGWDVLLDAAAYVPTNPLDLSQYSPEFVSMSFYKMFGYPTGVGALIMKKSIIKKMHRPWFAGGTIQYVSVDPSEKKSTHFLWENHEGFEDGTLNFLSIPAITEGLDFLSKIGMQKVQSHVGALTWRLVTQLAALKHANDQPQLLFCGPANCTSRGGNIAFFVLDNRGEIICSMEIEKRANENGISLRTGCFCNPGAATALFPESWNQSNKLATKGEIFSARQVLLDTISAVRCSVGLATSLSDIDALVALIKSFRSEEQSQNNENLRTEPS